MQESLNLSFEQSLRSRSGALYVNLDQLGRGGSAETYLVSAASGPHSGLLFALKVFRRKSRPTWRDSFLKEVEFLGTCDHPAILRVFDEGLYLDEHPFVVAQYLPRTLTSVIRARISTVEKLSYALQLLAGLKYLAGLEVPVVHRDVKPQNIFLNGGTCVLGDFGLMKRFNPDPVDDREFLKESTTAKGMPRNYRTPDLVEYLNGGPEPTPKSDVFQLGLVFAELFAGRNPQRQTAIDDFGTPVVLDPIGFVPGSLGRPIKELILSMLEPTTDARPSADRLLDAWRPLFLDAARRSRALNGNVF